jgi:NAD(P)H-dependent FMN reductase
VFLLDDIARRPAETLREILAFVGADPSKAGRLPPDYNPKSQAAKMQMPDSIRDVLIAHFAEEIRRCATLLGGAARSWPSLYNL